jgi:hypothetical protein
MQGEITKYRDDLRVGVITIGDGRRYRFSRSQILSATGDLLGHEVDFILSADGPTEIIVVTGSLWGAFGGLAVDA